MWGRLYYADLARRAGKGSAAVKTYERLIDTCDALVAEGDAANAGDAAIGKGECLYIQSYARVGLARYYSTRHEFDKAVTQLEEVPDNSPIKPKAQATAQKVNGLELPRKSPVLAGALSVVPGLGHFYIEEYGAGVAAILWNGVFIYAFVDSIFSRRYGQAALIGLVESIWYSGTIFGAISGAHRFNRDARRIVEEGMTRELNRMDDPNPWPARFPTPRQGVQFQLEWTF